MDSRTADVLRAIEFAELCFKRWLEMGRIQQDQYDAIIEHYQTQRKLTEMGATDCTHLSQPFPDETPDSPQERWRFFQFVLGEVQLFVNAGSLSLHAAHACSEQVAGRMRALEAQAPRRRPEPEIVDEVVAAEAVDEQPSVPSPTPEVDVKPKTPAAPKPKRSLLELLLDPKGIQYLMMAGGALLVLGLVIWLIASGIFENPLVVALALGTANVAVLAGGAAMIRFTRYTTAGRAIALLACAVMPLNLWFYDFQGLIPLYEGGHLWIPALVMCVIYAAAARLVRESSFVYVLVGGVAMTGMLILADNHFGWFYNVAAQSTLLAVIGMLAIHAERAFAPGEGDFSRERFGRAFFRAGHVVLGVGLLILLGGRITGWLYEPIFSKLNLFDVPAIMTEWKLQLLSLAIVAGATYVYFYSDLISKTKQGFSYIGVVTLLWCEILLVDLLPIELTEELFLFLLAATALAANIAQLVMSKNEEQETSTAPRLTDVAASLGLFMAIAPVVLGVLMYMRATFEVYHAVWPHELGWAYVGVMALTAVSCRLGAHVFRKTSPPMTSVYFFGAAAATLLTVVGAFASIGYHAWDVTAPWLMLVPIFYVIAANFYDKTAATSLRRAAHVATGVMIAAVVGAALNFTPERRFDPIAGEYTNLLLALFFAEAAVFYALTAFLAKQTAGIYGATATGCGAVWQLLYYAGISDQWYITAFAAVGLLILIGYRFSLTDKFANPAVALAAFRCGNTLVAIAGAAGVLFSLSRFPAHEADLSLVPLLAMLIGASIVAAVLVADDTWRRVYIVLAVAQGAAMFFVFTMLTDLTIWQKFELFSLAAGAVLLVIGHVGWYREDDQHADSVTTSLLFGTILAAVPLVLGLLGQRFTFEPDFSSWGLFQELSVLVVGLALLGGGLMCRIRATTIGGAIALAVYVATLLCFVHLPEQLQHTAVYMMIGGGLLFGSAVAMSICRDRILALPDKIRDGEGVFRVLHWR